MSIISPGSNPESLYIYGTQDYFWFDTYKKIPISDTYDFFETYITSDAHYNEDIDVYDYNKIKLWSDWVYDDGKHFKVHFQHEEWDDPIIMWEVTWNYILNDFKRRLDL